MEGERMDFSFSPEEEHFRQELRGWLQRQSPCGLGLDVSCAKGRGSASNSYAIGNVKLLCGRLSRLVLA